MKFPWQVELPLWGGASENHRPRAGSEPRRILLGDRIIHYTLRRSRRRTIGLTIDHHGLRVGAPSRSSMGEVESLIRKHAVWVVEKLDTWRDRPTRNPHPLEDGAMFPLLGQSARLRIGAGRNAFVWNASGQEGLVELELRISVDSPLLPVFERAMRERARTLFAERLAHFCKQFAISPPVLRLTNARTRWGSCSRLSGIRLNWRLIHAPLTLIDYVLAHELAHLKEMNHTARFWSEVERLYPDYSQARQQLRVFGETLPRFG